MVNPEKLGSKERITSIDFVMGILGTVAQNRHGFAFRPTDSRLHDAFVDAYKHLEEQQEVNNFNLRFHCHPNLHGYSVTIADAIYSLHGIHRFRNMYGEGNGKLIIPTVDPDWHEAEIARLPGGKDLYEGLAQIFIDSYEASPAAR